MFGQIEILKRQIEFFDKKNELEDFDNTESLKQRIKVSLFKMKSFIKKIPDPNPNTALKIQKYNEFIKKIEDKYHLA